MSRRAVLVLCGLLAWTGEAALADAPRGIPAAIETVCTGSGTTRACATIDRRAKRTIVRRAAGRAIPWSAAVAPPAVLPRADGLMIAEEYRPGGMIELDDGPGTLLVVLRGPNGVAAQVALGDIVRRPADLPRSVSHRIWSIVRFFDREGSYVADLPDGRRLRVTASGRKLIESAQGDLPAFCRYAQPDPHGPCARR